MRTMLRKLAKEARRIAERGDCEGVYAFMLSEVERLGGPEPTHATVELYRASGKYYTEEPWRIPEGAIGPYDMRNSPDFRRIDNAGVVVVPAQEPWGFPHVFMP